MKHVADRAQDPERPQSLEELRRRLNRRLSDMRRGWTRCDHQHCRRRKQCCGEGPDFKCTDDGRPRRTFSPEETAKAMSDLYKAVKRRRAEYAAGAELPDAETPRKLDYTARAAARRMRKSAQAAVAKAAAPSSRADRAKPAAPVAEQTPLAPEKVERIDRPRNDIAASQPAAPDQARERRPRITLL
jgi:hypothetical protein